MEKKLTKITIILLFVSIIFCSKLVYATSNDSSPLDEFLPSSEDINHGFRNEVFQEENLNEDGFIEGRSVNYDRSFDNHIIMELHIRVYHFSDAETAYNYLNKTIQETKSIPIYYELEIPPAFAIITEDEAEVGYSWSQMNDLVFNVEVFNNAGLEDTEEMLVYYTELELDAIPEFQSLTLILILIIATISTIVIKRKF